MHATPPPVDLVTITTAIVGILFGGVAGAQFGPYVLTAFASTVFACFAVTKRDDTRGRRIYALSLIAVHVVFALAVTMLVAQGLEIMYTRLTWRWYTAPLACYFGYVGPFAMFRFFDRFSERRAAMIAPPVPSAPSPSPPPSRGSAP